MTLKKSSKIMDLALKSTLLGCLALGASGGAIAAGSADGSEIELDTSLPSLAKGEAFVLVNMEARRAQASFSLNSSENKLALRIRPQEQMQLIKVKAGTYTARVPGSRTTGEIHVAAGTVTYIGDWKMVGKQKFMINGVAHTTNKQSLRVIYDVDNLFDFAEANPWVTQYPLHVSGTSGKRVSNKWVRTGQQTAANFQAGTTATTTDS